MQDIQPVKINIDNTHLSNILLDVKIPRLYVLPLSAINNLGNTHIKGSPAHRYNQQKYNVLKRGLKFDITLNEWWEVWNKSGKWNERGIYAQQYCMCRFKDEGHYTAGNVYIATNKENCTDGFVFKPHSVRKNYKKLPDINNVKGYWPIFYKNGLIKFCVNLRGKYIGLYLTENEARQAYLKARELESLK